MTSIHNLAEANDASGVRQLLASNPGAVNEQDGWGRSPLFVAASKNTKEVAEVLVVAVGVNIDLRNKEGYSPLYVAAYKNSKDVAELLLAAGATVDLQNKDGKSPLFETAYNNSKEVAQLLLSRRANADLQDKEDRSPLYVAAYKNSKDVAELLLAAGATIDLQNKWGQSPLFVAAYKNSKEVAELLLAAGATVDLQNKDGKTPLMIATECGHSEIVTLLSKYLKMQQEAPKEAIWGRSRIMIVGEGRAGKTSFYKSMKGIPLSEDSKSTCGLEKSSVRFYDIGEKVQGISLSPLANHDNNILNVAATKQIKLNLEESYKQKMGHHKYHQTPNDKAILVPVNDTALDKKADVSSRSLSTEKDDDEVDFSADKVSSRSLSTEKDDDEVDFSADKVSSRSLSTEKDDNEVQRWTCKKFQSFNLEYSDSDDLSLNDEFPSEHSFYDVHPSIHMHIGSKPNSLNEMTENDKLIREPSAEEVNGVPINLLGNISHKDLDISVIDYGGQKIFHCFHHLFLKPYGVYCILFNIEKFLTDEVNTLHHIRYWYNSINLHTSNQENGNVKIAVPIIIVGSHRDKLKQELDIMKISNKIQNMFKDSPEFANIVRCPKNLIKYITIPEQQVDLVFFPVDNRKDNKTDNIFQHLMIQIFKVISESNYVKEKISFDYFLVLDEIEKEYSKVNVEKKGKVLALIKKIILSTNNNVSLESKILKFFIDKGVFLEFNDQIIFHFDTFLINSITKIIYDPRYHNRARPSKYQWDMELQILLRRGVASDNFIRKLLNEGIDSVQNKGIDSVQDKGIDSFQDIGTDSVQNKGIDSAQDKGIEAGHKINSKNSNETDLIINFMLQNNLLILINEKNDNRYKRYLIPSLLSDSKLSQNTSLSPSALFFFKILRCSTDNNFDPNNCFMSDNLFYQLICKLINLSKLTAVSEAQDDFIFKDLIMIKLGAHVIVLKSFLEANCIMLHALNEIILRNYIIILTYIIQNEITPRVDFDIVIDQKTFYSSTHVEEIWNHTNFGENISNKNEVLLYCPKKSYVHLPDIFLTVIVTLSNYNIFFRVQFYEKQNDINVFETNIQNPTKQVLIVSMTGMISVIATDRYQNMRLEILVREQLDHYIRSSNLGSRSLNENLDEIKLLKNTYFSNGSVQFYYNTLSRLYYGWESSRHDDDHMLYYKVSVLSTEIYLFFRSILFLNGSHYVFRQFPGLLSCSKSPAKFLGSILKETLESLNPIMKRELRDATVNYNIQEAYKILVCLVQLSSAITAAISNHPIESEELQQQHRKVERMMKRLLSSNTMSDEAKLLSALLGENVCPLLDCYKNSEEGLRKLRAAVFTDSIIATYITEKENESNMYTLIGSWQVSTIIDKAFWNCSRILTVNGKSIWGCTSIFRKKDNENYGKKTTVKIMWGHIYRHLGATSSNCSRLSSNPSLLLFLELLFSILNLILVIYSSLQDDEGIIEGKNFPNDNRSYITLDDLKYIIIKSRIQYDLDDIRTHVRGLCIIHNDFFSSSVLFNMSLDFNSGHLRLLLSVMVLGVCLRELGELYSEFSRIDQSQAGTTIIAAIYRSVVVYFKDFWNMFDVVALVSLLCWSILQYLYNPPFSPTVKLILSLTLKLSAIPLTIGLLRFFLVLKEFGQFIIVIFSMTFDLWRFGFIYLVFLLGFGISLKAIFNEYKEFNNIYNLFITMFQMSLNTFSYDTFDYDENRYVGQMLIVVMVLSFTIVLVNAIIAKFGITFRNINDNVSGIWAINKARYTTRYLNNRSPVLMLPPPLNIFLFVVYLAMRVCAWVSNIAVFLIPKKQIHNWWYAHADLINDCTIGVCASISSVVYSIMLLPICAVVESFVFMSAIIPLAIVRICSINLNMHFISQTNQTNKRIHSVGLFFFFFVFFFFRLILFATSLLCIASLSFVVLPLVILYYILLLFLDIILTFSDNMTFYYYKVNLMHYFLTREGRDIWDIKGPKVLEEMIKPEFTYQQGIKNNSLSRISIISRIKWFYYNFAPEKSLRFIYEEYEYGNEFLWKMLGYLRKGVDKISKDEKESIYDTLVPPVIPNVNEKDPLLTAEDCKRIFAIEDEEEHNFSFLKEQLSISRRQLQKINKKIQNLENRLLEKMDECFKHQESKNDETNTSLNSDMIMDRPQSTYYSYKSKKETDVSRCEQYMKYFHDASTTKLVEDGKYASRFAFDD